MFEISGFTPYVIGFFVIAGIATGLAVVALAQVAAEVRAPRSRPVVLVTTERTPAGAAA